MLSTRQNCEVIASLSANNIDVSIVVFQPNLRVPGDDVVRLQFFLVVLKASLMSLIDIDTFVAIFVVKLQPYFSAPRLRYDFTPRFVLYCHLSVPLTHSYA